MNEKVKFWILLGLLLASLALLYTVNNIIGQVR